MNFSQRFQNLRKKNKLTQKELSLKLQLPQSSISGYENNERKPSISILIDIAKTFNTTIDYLLGLSNIEEESNFSYNFTDDNYLGQKIQNLRKSNHINQKALADKLKVTQATVSAYETGKTSPNIDILIKLSKILNCSTDELLGQRNNVQLDNVNLDNTDIQHRLKYLRHEKKWSQNDIAKYLNIPTSLYSSLENESKEIDGTTLKNIAKLYDVTTDYLLGLTDIRNHEKGKAAELLENHPAVSVLFDRDVTEEESLEMLEQFLDFVEFQKSRGKMK
ncbi:helix-turn-helix domain-containing protein [Listeria rustica]|uniref:Helix-turn-helix transcriptional regulator n=1 Tax=Listeria rustica TaxID=2713503 RepID=A0A7W1T4X1_9LIST|nr:helix-turn-helix transcriptional regulator [Listeria rustica]MBA3925520.1 helix-turn-helix transcriptional regulator [Listeria rustica]